MSKRGFFPRLFHSISSIRGRVFPRSIQQILKYVSTFHKMFSKEKYFIILFSPR